VYMIANADARGIVDADTRLIQSVTGLTVDQVRESTLALESPDPESRTSTCDGARIVRIDEHRDWGWLIVNHEKYMYLTDLDHKRQLTRDRVRKHRASKHVTRGNDTQTQTQTQKEKDFITATAVPDFGKAFEVSFWPLYPRKVGKPAAVRAWRAQKIADQKTLDSVMAGLRAHMASEWPGRELQFIPHPATWLNGRRWEDEIGKVAPIDANAARKALEDESMRRARENQRRKLDQERLEFEREQSTRNGKP